MNAASRSTGPPADVELPDDPRLMRAVQDYLAELEAGRRPHRREFLQRYPDLAEPLTQCLDGLDLVHKAAIRESGSGVRTAPVGPNPSQADSVPADPLGDFKIVREIGRGGMGVVYEAVQLSLGRRVALKVLPFAATLDPKQLLRFKHEAQAAAHVHHTNIVPVYYVGCERGVHFYAMQLIDGQPLSAVIEEVRSHSADSRQQTESRERVGANSPQSENAPHDTVSQLSLALSTHRSTKPRDYFRTAARFLVQAAEALEHAHQSGIVHRDIKPANLLVDVHGRLWITDFGLAQFHADVVLTQTGDLVGTLRYMSPEQASGSRLQLDHRTDIYSLGATLYELTTLQPIFPGTNRQELLYQIAHDEPRSPRALVKTMPVELETIILKAVGKHPADRYATANDFAADLQRYLDDQPILARRPSLIDRARKWSRRHPSIVAAGVLLLVVCIVGLLVNNWMIGQEQDKTQAALARAKQRASEARRALDLLVVVSEQELSDQPYLQGVRKRLLQTALDYYQDFINARGDDADAQAELQAGKLRVRSILDELITIQGANLLGLARDKDVQDDLKLADAQRDRLVNLHERTWEQRLAFFQEQRSLAPEARRQKFYELAKNQEAGLGDILQPHQIHRLRQIELQLQGPRAFVDSYAVDALKLTAEQKRQIRDIKEEILATMWPEPKAASGGPPSGRGQSPGPVVFGKKKDFEKFQRKEVERILAILTPEQKSQWQELTGAPFSGGPRPVFPGGFVPPRGPFGQGPPPDRRKGD